MSLRRPLCVLSLCLAFTLVPLACGSNTTTTPVHAPSSTASAPTLSNTSTTSASSSTAATTSAPTTSASDVATADSSGPPSTTVDDCPPSCGPDGSWFGCGLRKPRGNLCAGCKPRCKGRDTKDEGWYDCQGVEIVAHKCP